MKQDHIINFMGAKVAYLTKGDFDYMQNELENEKVYDVQEVVKSPNLIIDCGANIGLATIYLKHLYPQAAVLAFEPDPTTFEVLNQNIETNTLEKVHCFPWALGNKEGDIPFYRDTERPGSLLMSTIQERLPKQEISVQGKKLSWFLEREQIEKVDILKIDVEGAEWDILEDLVKSGAIKKVEHMLIEYHHKIAGAPSRLSAFLKILEDEGFEYQLQTEKTQERKKNTFQDILIFTYKNTDAQ